MGRSEAICGGQTFGSNETRRSLVLASAILGTFMSAVEGTIVATAMPSIVGELGGFSLFSWVFSAFLLTQAISIPIYGKLADLFGRKPVFIVGVGIFLSGSLLCGLAHTMQGLILFRFIQGLGAGAIEPIALTIVGDIYTLEERARIQGYISSVWGFASVIGPALGGIFVQYLHWAWVFWLNIPIGILTVIGMGLFLHEQVEKRAVKIDAVGAGLLLVALSTLMVVLIQVGAGWSLVSLPSVGLLVLFAMSLTFFIVVEKHFSEPMMPLKLWKDRLIAIANVGALTTGIVVIGVTTFIPTYMQGVMGTTPTVAGFTLAVMSIAWPIASTISGRVMLKWGFRTMVFIGSILLLAGTFFFVTLSPAKGIIWAGIGSLLIGAGMGPIKTTFIVSVQTRVDWKMRGVATASNMFMRILGSTVGAAMLGGILNHRMSAFLKNLAVDRAFPMSLDVTNTLLDPKHREVFPVNVLAALKQGLGSALHGVFLGMMVLALLSLVLLIFFPRQKEEQM